MIPLGRLSGPFFMETPVRKLLAAAFVCYLFLAAAPVWAATLTWTNPTSFSDGSPLVAADIASTKVEWAASNAFLSVVGSLSVAGAATTTDRKSTRLNSSH